MLSDSVRSFYTIHDRLRRCESGELRGETCLADELAAKAGLDIRSRGFASNLWDAAQQSYSLDPVMVVFGRHHIAVKTFLSDTRITTFFADESEVEIIDPSQISEVQGFSCEVEFIPATESEP